MSRRGGYFTREQLHNLRYIIKEHSRSYDYDGEEGFEDMVDSLVILISKKLELN